MSYKHGSNKQSTRKTALYANLILAAISNFLNIADCSVLKVEWGKHEEAISQKIATKKRMREQMQVLEGSVKEKCKQ